MQRLLWILILMMLFVIPVMAQDAPTNTPQDTSTTQSTQSGDTQTAPTSQQTAAPEAPIVYTNEISGGFTLHRIAESGSNALDMVGGYGDFEHNIFQRWFGAEIQVSGAYKNQGAPGILTIYTITAGPVFYPFGHRKITPFGHVLFGEGFYRNSIAASTGFPAQVDTHTSFAWAAGAGLDLMVSRRLAVRLAQFDYAQTKFISGALHENDIRISVGIVYHLGGK